jgi:AraC-like DNA-binding protein
MTGYGHFMPIVTINDDIRVPASYLAVFLDRMARDDATRAEIMASVDLDFAALEEGQARLTLAQMMAALVAIDAKVPPGWHIEPALGFEAAHHGPLGVAMVTAASVGQALDILIRYEPTRAPWAMLKQDTDHDRFSLRIVPTQALGTGGALLMEIHLLALAGLIGQLLGMARSELVLNLPKQYRSWEPALRQALPGPIDFSASHYGLIIPREKLQRPCLLADPALHDSAVARCENLLIRNDSGGSLAARMRQKLVDLEGRSPGLAAMAEQFHTSPRSLIRHLASTGTSYQNLIDEVRACLARDWLWYGETTVAEIAERLGYRDPANFGRAFRRWYGISPGQLRRRGPPR